MWRFRVVVACGVAFALAVTFLSVFRVSFAHGLSVSYRQGLTWQSTEMLSLAPANGCFLCEGSTAPTSLYAQIANSSAVIRNRVLPDGQATSASGDYVFSPVLDSSAQNQALPFLQVDGTASTPKRAAYVAHLASSTFADYLAKSLKNVPRSKRFVAQVVTPATAGGAKIAKSRKLTIPIFIFLAALVAVLGLVYLLENLRPRTSFARVSAEPKLEPLVLPDPEPRLESLEPAEAQPRSEPRRARAAAAAETTRGRT
jgi:hypothetical protein